MLKMAVFTTFTLCGKNFHYKIYTTCGENYTVKSIIGLTSDIWSTTEDISGCGENYHMPSGVKKFYMIPMLPLVFFFFLKKTFCYN